MKHVRTQKILDFEVVLETGHLAWNTYEKQTGRSILLATQLGAMFSAGISLVYEFGWALATKWVRDHGHEVAPSGFTYDTWLLALPDVGTPEWADLHGKVGDLIALAFYNQTWDELIAVLEGAGAKLDGPAEPTPEA